MSLSLKKSGKFFSHPVTFTLLVSAGLLVWLSALYGLGTLLLH